MSYAHIFAVAGMARVSFGATIIHDYGVDGQFEEIAEVEEGVHVPTGFPLMYQAKASVRWRIAGDHVLYRLDGRAYNNIATRRPAANRLILILLCLPRDMQEWHSVTESVTSLRNCCYWHWFEGPRTAKSGVGIRIPRKQIFTPEVLKDLLEAERLRQEAAAWTT